MNVALVEDDKNSQERIKKYFKQYDEENGIDSTLTVFGDGADFLTGYKSNYDVVLMDIEMPFVNGMDAARKLREFDSDVLLIFITNLKQFALKGYEVEAMDFLIKPMTYAAFQTMITRVMHKLAKNKGQVVVFTNAKGTYRVKLEDIYYIESLNHYVIIHSSGGEKKLWGSLKEIEKKLPENRFARCNSGYIVNLAYVRNIDGNDVYVGNEVLNMSRGKKAEFRKKFLEYMNE